MGERDGGWRGEAKTKENPNVRSLRRGCTRDCTTLKEPAWPPPVLAAGSSADCGMYTRIGTLRKSREVFRRREFTLVKDA